MIIVRLSGDLGSQMFQYAFGRRIALIHRTPLKLDIGEFERSFDAYGLDRFHIRAEIAKTTDVSQLINLHHLRGDTCTIDPAPFPVQTRMEESPYLATVANNTYLSGHCWTLRYFAKLQPLLRREFSLKAPAQEETKKYLKQMDKEQSVSVCLCKNKTNDTAVSCPVDYYYRAVETIAERLSHPVFYLFSSDADISPASFPINYPHRWITAAAVQNPTECFRLLCACKHQIIANTALSWWTAWLNPSRKKMIVAPARWSAPNAAEEEFLPSRWIRL